jgi:hypothetical protein
VTSFPSGAVHHGAGPAAPGHLPDASTFVLPAYLTEGHADRGPRFGQQVWDVRAFVPRTTRTARIDFTTISDPAQARTAREYLYSRVNRGIPSHGAGPAARPMKITNLYGEFGEIRTILADLDAAGAPRLSDVTHEHLTQVLAIWKRSPVVAAGLAGVVKHLAAHGEFLTDRLAIVPWLGRTANMVAGRASPQENATPRIPEQIIAPLLAAAVFYVRTAAPNLIACQTELAALHTHNAGRLGKGEARSRLENFIDQRARAGRGIPAPPAAAGTARKPSLQLIALLAGVPSDLWYHRDLIIAAGERLGYGGARTAGRQDPSRRLRHAGADQVRPQAAGAAPPER